MLLQISATCDEPLLKYRPRKWIARDASIDTSELRCHSGPGPLVFTVFQPEGAAFSNLTSIHFEKVSLLTCDIWKRRVFREKIQLSDSLIRWRFSVGLFSVF